MKKICLINCPNELGAGRRGASLGFSAMSLEAIDIERKKSIPSIFSTCEIRETPVRNDLLKKPEDNYCAKNIEGIAVVQETLSMTVFDILQEGKFPIMIGGDHSNSIGSVSGVKKFAGFDSVAVLWIDAHADLHSPFTTPSGNVHGMPIASLMHEDNMDNAVNQPNMCEQQAWIRLKNNIPIDWRIKADDICFLGLRDFESPEEELIEKYKILSITVDQAHELGAKALATKIFKKFENHKYFHISWDVDSIDPSYSDGTGTPVDKGLHLDLVESLIQILIASGKITSMDIVEISPILDTKNAMAKIALNVLENTCKQIEQGCEKLNK